MASHQGLMNRIRRSWPISGFILIAVAHQFLLRTFFNDDVVDKLVIFVLQMGGIIVVIFSLDENFRLIQGKHIPQVLIRYLKEWLPAKPTHHTASGNIVGSKASVSFGVSIVRNAKTVEAKLAYLQEQIDDLKAEYQREFDSIKEEVRTGASLVQARLQELSSSINTLEGKVVEFSTGGLNGQVFGVLLIGYASWIDLWLP